MNKIKKKKAFRIKAGALALLIFVSAAVLPLNANNVCESALVRCEADAIISMIFGGVQVFAAYSFGCLIGYAWCLRYFL